MAQVNDIDIYRSAQVLIERHGDEARLHAATRADELLDRGDLDGLAVWKRIRRAIEELSQYEAPPGQTH